MSTAVPVAAPPAERRIAPRRQPAMGTVCDLDPSGESGATGLVWNISASGVSMLVTEPREAGAVIRGELKTLRGRLPLAVEMQVVHVKQLETGDYFLGAHFARPLTAAELRPFVG